MSKRNVFLGAGAVLLTVASAFAGRATRTAPPSLFFTTSGTASHCHNIGSISSSTHLTTASAGTGQATFTTGGGASGKVYGNSTCTVAVNYKS